MGLFDRLFGPAPPKVDVHEAYARLQTADPPLIVDVRQALERRTGVIPGAVLIPLTEFGRRYSELPRDRPILTICASNHRSPLAARRLFKAGYNVTDVAGGLNAWEAAGLPLER